MISMIDNSIPKINHRNDASIILFEDKVTQTLDFHNMITSLNVSADLYVISKLDEIKKFLTELYTYRDDKPDVILIDLSLFRVLKERIINLYHSVELEEPLLICILTSSEAEGNEAKLYEEMVDGIFEKNDTLETRSALTNLIAQKWLQIAKDINT